MPPALRAADRHDRAAILRLVVAAFGRPGYDAQQEVDIVRSVWRAGTSPPGLELVAVTDGALAGHVLASVGDLDGDPVLGIAPLCVDPTRQGRGIGSSLMVELLARSAASGWSFALLLGDPAYYQRFGFTAASAYGIVYPPVGAGNPHFMIRAFASSGSPPAGEYRYSWEIE